MDLYSQMGDELRSLFKDLFDPKRVKGVEKKMEYILATAAEIGGPLKIEADQLYSDVMKFLKNPKDQHLLALMKKHALRLEQETREI